MPDMNIVVFSGIYKQADSFSILTDKNSATARKKYTPAVVTTRFLENTLGLFPPERPGTWTNTTS